MGLLQLTGETHAYTDLVFGLFRLLGYRFSPRIADLDDLRYWRLDGDADYGPLDGLTRNRVKADLIVEHWGDILRVAGSLLTQPRGPRTSRASCRPTAAEIPREGHRRARQAPEDRPPLNYLGDAAYRRTIGGQLNLHERRHSLARAVSFGKKGEVRKRYREGQQDQLGALGLVVDVGCLFDSLYLDEAVRRLRAGGEDVADEDLARVSPLAREHVRVLGR